MKIFLKLTFLVLIILSCQNRSKSYLPDTFADSVNGVIELNSISNAIDTIDVQSRFLQGDAYQSNIGLDFAIIGQKIIDTSNYKLINQVCAVSVIPDTTWINRNQQSMPEDEWNTIVSDNQYYEQIAIDTLEKLNIPTIFAPREKRYIKFLKSNGTVCIVDLNKMIDAWGLILFNGTDNPVLWSSTEIDKEIKEIYKK